jgi:hypothetical protein
MIVAVLGIFAAIAPQPAHAIGTPCQEFSIFVDLVEATFPGGQPYQRTQDNTFGTSGKTVMEHPFLDNTCGTSSTTASSLAYTQHLGIGTQKTSMVEIGVVVWYGNFPDTSTLNYGIFTEAENYPNVAGPYIDYNLASTYSGPIWLKIEGFNTPYFYLSYDASNHTTPTWTPARTFTGLPLPFGTPEFESSVHANAANGGAGVDARMAMWNMQLKSGYLANYTPWYGQTCTTDNNISYQPNYDATSTTTGAVQPGPGQCVTI